MLDKKLREGCFDDRFSRSLSIVHIGGKSVGHRLGQLNVERLHDGKISIDASILDRFIIFDPPPFPRSPERFQSKLQHSRNKSRSPGLRLGELMPSFTQSRHNLHQERHLKVLLPRSLRGKGCLPTTVSHGLVRCPHEWRVSSFHRWVEQGMYAIDWGCGLENGESLGIEAIGGK
jgi:hypothetical protein